MISPRRRLGTVAAVMGLTIALAACTSTEPEAEPIESSAPATAELRVGLVLEPTDLDIRHTSGIALDQVLIGNLYEGLVGLNPDGDIEPQLASEYDISDDGLRYEFRLNDGITFHDGHPVTAIEVRDSLQHVMTSDDVVGYDAFRFVENIEAPDSDRIVISLERPDSQLLWRLAGRAGLVVPVSDTLDLSNSAVGTGPFTLSDWRQGDSISLRKNADYWGAPAGLDTVQFRYFTDPSAAANAVLTGDVDVQTALDPTLAQQFDDNNDVTVVEGDTTDVFTLAFNNARDPLTDVRVRTAIRHAIDHDALIEAVGGAAERLGGPIPRLDPGYEDLTGVTPYDPDRARALLREAGTPELSLSLTIPNHYSTTIGTVLTSQLRQVGIELDVNTVEFPLWLNDVLTNHSYDLSVVNHAEARDFGNWANPNYYFNYSNDEVVERYEQGIAARSETEANEAFATAARIVSEDSAGDWLYSQNALTAIRAGVEGFPTNSTTARLDLGAVTLE